MLYIFCVLDSLWLHQALVHFTNPLKPKQPQKKKELKKKLRIANAKKYECSICGKVYITKGGKSTFRLHMETEHGQPPLCPCNICGKPCQGSKDLKRHIHTHLGKDEKAEAKINSEQIHLEKCLCSECGALYSEKGKVNFIVDCLCLVRLTLSQYLYMLYYSYFGTTHQSCSY